MKNKLFLCLCSSILFNMTFAQTDIPYIWYGDTILYVMPENSANYVEWGGYGIDITIGNAAANQMNGQLNTSSIVEQLGNNGGVPYAAKFCDTLTAFGYSDWYLPAHFELFRICQKADSIGDFKDDSYIYWNSTQSLGMLPTEPSEGGIQMFGLCEASSHSKNLLFQCRCIRREYPSKVKSSMYNKNILFNQDKSQESIEMRVLNKNEEIKILVYDVNGKLLMADQLNSTLTENTISLSYVGFGRGTYIVKLIGKSFEESFKFVVD